MNYKSAATITEDVKQVEKNEKEKKEKVRTRVERVIKYSDWPEKPGWVKISYALEEVPIVPKTPPPPDKISLGNYVRLQERRAKEYDAMRWPGAFRETFSIRSHSVAEIRDGKNIGIGIGSPVVPEGDGDSDLEDSL